MCTAVTTKTYVRQGTAKPSHIDKIWVPCMLNCYYHQAASNTLENQMIMIHLNIEFFFCRFVKSVANWFLLGLYEAIWFSVGHFTNGITWNCARCKRHGNIMFSFVIRKKSNLKSRRFFDCPFAYATEISDLRAPRVKRIRPEEL